VDFSYQTYAGAMTLAGAGASGSVNCGTYGFTAPLSSATTDSLGHLTQTGDQAGSITSCFYGPIGEEIGGIFQMTVPAGHAGAGTLIVGAAVAKQ
jgi:hypothetical protein